MVDIWACLGYNDTIKNPEGDENMHTVTLNTDVVIRDNYGINVFKRTDDSLYPSYQLYSGNGDDDETRNMMLVEVTFMKLADDQIADDKCWRVCVWGDDDCGMEKDYISYNNAWDDFVAILQMEMVNMEKLRELGFYGA